MKNILLITLIIILYLIDLSLGQACSTIGDSVTCNDESACTWNGGQNGQCNCASEVKLDILFGSDTSGSIGLGGFRVQKNFVRGLVENGVANDSRLGFYMFNTEVNKTREIQSWKGKETELLQFVDGMWWSGGWTNTGQLISDGLEHFADPDIYDASRQQVFIIITDGNPCLPQSQGGCPQSACQFKTQVFQAGVRVVVIGVGDGLNSKYVKCLTQSDSDWIPVSGYNEDAFNEILGSLSDVLCPVSKEFKVTEVKAKRKEDGTYKGSSPMPARLGRFVEIYNSGIDFNISDITISGLITMALNNAIDGNPTVLQSQYAVFFDASEEPFLANNGGSTPTCHMCEWDASNDDKPCDLSGCGTGAINAGNDQFTGTCFCANSVYIACSNDEDSNAVANCRANAKLSDANVYDGCGICVFESGYTNTGWDILFSDLNPIDEVVHSKSGTGSWITPTDGYSLELAWKGFDNDYGTSWIQSCSRFGTPGSDPYAECDEDCVTLGSDCGGTGTCDPDTGNCLCDATTGYYPSCQTPSQNCYQCSEVPQVEECVVVWRKNESEKYAYYNWTVDVPSFANGGFFLQYFANQQAGECSGDDIGGGPDAPCNVVIKQIDDFDRTDAIYDQFKRENDYYTLNDTVGGYVYAFEAVCDTASINTATTCSYYVSDAIPCFVVTSAPTNSPTNSPTVPPTPEPTNNPTMSPTYACPRYWIDDEEVCKPKENDDDGYAGDRCECTGKDYYDEDTRNCCFEDPGSRIWESGKYDAGRTHKGTCYTDAQLEEPECRYSDSCDDDEKPPQGTTAGYLLSQGEHSFQVAISPEAQSCRFEICWELDFTRTDCNYGDRRRMADSTIVDGQIVCSEDSTSLAAAGLKVVNTSGCFNVSGLDDIASATIDFEVVRLDCEEAEDELEDDDDDDDDDGRRRRRRLGDDDCFESIAIYGELRLTNTSSECQPDCPDGRVYPMQFPVWYNYQEAFVAPPAEERELPAWLWWLIAALVVFLALLALLVYKYWWKNKATGAALGATQADLDAAVMENEQGFGGDLQGGAVGFNPLATGFNPNAPAGPMNPNAPPNGGGGGGEFIRPNVEKQVFREQYGQNRGAFR